MKNLNIKQNLADKKRGALISANDDVLFQKAEDVVNNGELNFTE